MQSKIVLIAMLYFLVIKIDLKDSNSSFKCKKLNKHCDITENIGAYPRSAVIIKLSSHRDVTRLGDHRERQGPSTAALGLDSVRHHRVYTTYIY